MALVAITYRLYLRARGNREVVGLSLASYAGSSVQGGFATRIGDEVKFPAEAVFLWPEEQMLSELPPGAEIRGRLAGFSDSGSDRRVFAVVEVVKIQNVMVRVSDLEVIEAES